MLRCTDSFPSSIEERTKKTSDQSFESRFTNEPSKRNEEHVNTDSTNDLTVDYKQSSVCKNIISDRSLIYQNPSNAPSNKDAKRNKSDINHDKVKKQGKSSSLKPHSDSSSNEKILSQSLFSSSKKEFNKNKEKEENDKLVKDSTPKSSKLDRVTTVGYVSTDRELLINDILQNINIKEN